MAARPAGLSLTLRSLLWTVLLPGIYAGFIPWQYFGVSRAQVAFSNPVHLLAVALILFGACLLAACIWQFAYSGRGTLSPVDPPRELVVRGLYRYVRNPMYLSVTAIVLGEVLLIRSRGLLLYWAIWFVLVNLVVMGYEEPNLRRRFGQSYENYVRTVGRWIPRFQKG